MNRKNLTAAVLAGLAGAAGIAGTAQAVNLNPDGLGQVLIYPYYTVNGGNLTTLSVVNTSEEAKAVKVRFLEGQNSIEVLDFNLYLSAFDVWTAAVVDAAGTPTLVIEDRSCTVPDLVRDFGGSQAFLTYALAADGGTSDISRTREGHFEMIEMGTLVGSSAAAATHSGGEPSSCETLVDAWTYGPNDVSSADDGYWLGGPFDTGDEDEEGDPIIITGGAGIDIDPVSGGLFGGAAIVNPQNGTMFSYDARAINGYNEGVNGNDGNPLHAEPGTVNPSLNSGSEFDGFVFTDNGEVAWAEFDRSVDAVSFVFMHDAIMNEYATGGALNGSSEWVLTFPTKNFYVNGSGAPVPPFTSVWTDNFNSDDVDGDGDGKFNGDDDINYNDSACEPVFLDTIWDQEEDSPTEAPGPGRPPVVSPAPPTTVPGDDPFLLCYETNIIRFGADPGDSTEILGSNNFTNIDNETLGFEAGWARIDLFAYPIDSGEDGVFDSIAYRPPLGYVDDGEGGFEPTEFFDGDEASGLPVTGFWVFQAQNGFLGDGADVLANYGGLWNHKATKCFSGEFCRVTPDPQ